ncbi:hypothetical protein AX16_005025 [Volvariella volvacea WC 439]|nr:hypothetical protein AX16_005025 [Volvariella volvacea WC 439]
MKWLTIVALALTLVVASPVPEEASEADAAVEVVPEAAGEGEVVAARAPDFGVPGIDVSSWQGNVNWNTVRSNGVQWAYIKATEGTGYKNPYFSSQYTGATNAGLIRGSYHFALPDRSSGAAQATYFATNGGGWSADGITLPGALDVECKLLLVLGVALIRDFSNTYRSRTGRYPVIYTTTDWWRTCTGNNNSFGSNNPLWIARYASAIGTLPAGWSYTSFWQYADSGPNPGDQNIWNGDLAGLRRFLSSLYPSSITHSRTLALMDEIIPGLWLGNLLSALDAGTLKRNGISSVLTAMRGTVKVNPTLMRHQIPIDDSLEEEILAHLPSSIRFIQRQLGKGRGVLVHCYGGVSRSATIVTAYLMYTQNVGVEEALKTVKEKRPIVYPNENFLLQLQVFHASKEDIFREGAPVKAFYTERIVEATADFETPEVRALSDSGPSTQVMPGRRIRCKMCRQGLATREDMIDHGQLGPALAILASDNSGPSTEPQSVTQSVSDASGPSTGGQVAEESVTTSVDVNKTREGDRDQGSLDSGRIAQPKCTSSEAGNSPSATDTLQAEPAAQGDPQPNMQPQSTMTTSFNAALVLNPTLAALRSSHGLLSPATPSSTSSTIPTNPPLLTNPKCSGYFVEPMKWMEPFLSQGELAGKIMCPNKKCGAKLGNYDWAGICCGCKQWVTPGFCINRSKVDEVV